MNFFLSLTALSVFLSWLYYYFKMILIFKRFPPPRPGSAPPLKVYPFVSILVPARNEEANIGNCLESLLRLDYPNYEVIVIDDRSEDGTPQILETIKEKHPRLKILRLETSEAGWSGKNYALHRGVQLAEGEWYLFTDADTLHAPESVRLGLGEAFFHSTDFLTFLSQLDCKTFFEKMIQPIAGGLMLLWYPIEKLNNPRSSLGFANGQYLLLEKKTYTALGGHAAVKEKLLEDVALSERAKELRIPFRISIGVYAVKTRMYRGLKNSWNGWRRIFLHLAEKDPLKILATSVGFFFLGVLPAFLLAALILGHSSIYPVLLATLALGMSILARWKLNGLSRLARWPALVYPLGSLLVLGILLEALSESVLNKKTLWRGRHYL